MTAVVILATGATVSTDDPQWAAECMDRALCVNEMRRLGSREARRGYIDRKTAELGEIFGQRLEAAFRAAWNEAKGLTS